MESEVANMKTKSYEEAAEGLCFWAGLEFEQGEAIMNIAQRLDYLKRTLIEDARHVSAKFLDFADRIEQGYHADTPHGYSSLRDVETNAVAFRTNMDCLIRVIGSVCGGQKAIDEFRRELTLPTEE